MITKYKFTEDIIEYNGHILHRIIALKDFGDVKKGDLGGWVEKYENLSQEGDCWIYNNAKVGRNTKVYDNAVVYGYSEITGNAEIFEDSKVMGGSLIQGNAKIYGQARIRDRAMVEKNAQVYGNADVYGNAKIYGEARIYDKCMIRDSAKVYGNAIVSGNAEITGNAEVNSIKDYLVFKNNWSSGRYFTWTLSNNMWRVGCFYGTDEELIKKAYADSEESGRKYEKCVKFVEDLNK